MQIRLPHFRRGALRWLGILWLAPTYVLTVVLDAVHTGDPTASMAFGFPGAVLLGELARLVERARLASSVLALVLLLGLYRYVEHSFTRMESFVRRSS
ncbi:MAG: hypothetical protein ABI895_13830 [Deltaproteobacteria bacterium]